MSNRLCLQNQFKHRKFHFSFTNKKKNRKNALFCSQRVIFASEIVSVLWLFKILYISALHSFLNRYPYNLHFIAEYCVLRTQTQIIFFHRTAIKVFQCLFKLSKYINSADKRRMHHRWHIPMYSLIIIDYFRYRQQQLWKSLSFSDAKVSKIIDINQISARFSFDLYHAKQKQNMFLPVLFVVLRKSLYLCAHERKVGYIQHTDVAKNLTILCIFLCHLFGQSK